MLVNTTVVIKVITPARTSSTNREYKGDLKQFTHPLILGTAESRMHHRIASSDLCPQVYITSSVPISLTASPLSIDTNLIPELSIPFGV